jgi:hypothetical protein
VETGRKEKEHENFRPKPGDKKKKVKRSSKSKSDWRLFFPSILGEGKIFRYRMWYLKQNNFRTIVKWVGR